MTSPQRRRSDGSRPAVRMTKAERKRQLLAHAKHLFVTQGYHATTTEKIAQAAGVTEPVLYRHFDSKKALFLEVLEEVRAATLERWHAETSSLTDPLAKLHAIADMYLGSTRAHAVEFRIMHRTLVETDDEEIVALLRSFYLDSETLLAQHHRRGPASRRLPPLARSARGAWELIRTALGYTLTLPLGIPAVQRGNLSPPGHRLPAALPAENGCIASVIGFRLTIARNVIPESRIARLYESITSVRSVTSQALGGELLDVQFGAFEISGQENRTATVVRLPHLVVASAREARQFHDAADDEHQVVDGALVQDDLVARHLAFFFEWAFAGADLTGQAGMSGRSALVWLMSGPLLLVGGAEKGALVPTHGPYSVANYKTQDRLRPKRGLLADARGEKRVRIYRLIRK